MKIYFQAGFIPESQGRFKNKTRSHVFHHNNKIKDKNHMIVSIEAKTNFITFSMYPWREKLH